MTHLTRWAAFSALIALLLAGPTWAQEQEEETVRPASQAGAPVSAPIEEPIAPPAPAAPALEEETVRTAGSFSSTPPPVEEAIAPAAPVMPEVTSAPEPPSPPASSWQEPATPDPGPTYSNYTWPAYEAAQEVWEPGPCEATPPATESPAPTPAASAIPVTLDRIPISWEPSLPPVSWILLGGLLPLAVYMLFFRKGKEERR